MGAGAGVYRGAGGAGGKERRYMGGKKLEKFFREDTFPPLEDLLDKLHISEAKGFEIFRAFACIDTDENGTVDVNECFAFLGGRRTPFTERIFFHEEDHDGQVELGLAFPDFLMVFWQYCTLTVEGLARYVFEIFDPHDSEVLEKPDLEAMFRMLYDTDEHDEKYVSGFPFEKVFRTVDKRGHVKSAPALLRSIKSLPHTNNQQSKNNNNNTGDLLTHKQQVHAPDALQSSNSEWEWRVRKQAFVRYCAKVSKDTAAGATGRKYVLIQPAIDYQTKIRKRIGGVMMWESLTAYRTKIFKSIDIESKNLNEALNSIILAKNPNRRLKKLLAEELLAAQKAKIERDREIAEREWKLREEQLEKERLFKELTAEDRKMKEAWRVYEERFEWFGLEEFELSKDVWRRREERDKLYELLESALAETKAYWNWRDRKDTRETEGTDADHELRYEEYIKTEEGKVKYKFLQLHHLFKELLRQIRNKNAKNRYYKESKKSSKQIAVEAFQDDLQRKYDGIYDEEQFTEEQRAKKLKYLMEHDFTDEWRAARRYAWRRDFVRAEAITHLELCKEWRDKTLAAFYSDLAQRQEERRREAIKREFELATTYGSKITRWELMYDKVKDKMVYINCDTMELRHHKTAFCEKCDAIFPQNELRCIECYAPRSQKNLRLYRPLGFKDITLDD